MLNEFIIIINNSPCCLLKPFVVTISKKVIFNGDFTVFSLLFLLLLFVGLLLTFYWLFGYYSFIYKFCNVRFPFPLASVSDNYFVHLCRCFICGHAFSLSSCLWEICKRKRFVYCLLIDTIRWMGGVEGKRRLLVRGGRTDKPKKKQTDTS